MEKKKIKQYCLGATWLNLIFFAVKKKKQGKECVWSEVHLCDVNAGFLLVTECGISGNRHRGLGMLEPRCGGQLDGGGAGARERDLTFQFSS